jgi:ribosomal protein S18 acetylase RimI-like enzyme
MSTASANVVEPCVALPWDSAFFGIPIARVNGEALDDAKAAAIDGWCGEHAIGCVYFQACADDPATIRCAEKSGFDLVEMRMEYEHQEMSRVMERKLLRPGFEFREAIAADLPGLRSIARTSFTDARFYVDGRFPEEKCAGLYERWVEESCRGFADKVVVALQGVIPAGFITLKKEGQIGRISLVGVDAKFRGRGVGQNLIRSAMEWALHEGLEGVRVITQGRNIPSQRLYQRMGFLTHGVHLYFHKWF